MKKPSEVLREALALLLGAEWVQRVPDGPHEACAMSAINQTGASGHLWFAAREHLRAAAGARVISHWNDAGGRTFPEVKAAFERAIAAAESGGQ